MKKRYSLILILLFSIFITNVYASTNTYDRNFLDNYGVNKKWNITSKNKNNVLSTPAVDASEKVYDFADILTVDEEDKVYKLTQEYKDETGMELIILTYNLPYTYDSYNETFAADFYDYNDFGIDIENYSGVLLFRNTYERDPYYNLYMFGEAQLYYSVSRADSILDDIYDYFHYGNYYEGFDTLTNQLIKYYKKGYAPEYKYSYIDDTGHIKERYHIPWFTAILVSGIATAVIISILIGKNKMIRKAQEASSYIDDQSINYTKFEDIFITSHTSSYRSSSSSGSGGGSRSGSSGGGHSSGSGRHG